MLEEVVTGRRITEVPHGRGLAFMIARMSAAEIEAINAALDAKLEEIQPGEAISASWIPGADWTGTPFMPIYTKACRMDFTASAGCLGKIFMSRVIAHPDLWRTIEQRKPSCSGSTSWRRLQVATVDGGTLVAAGAGATIFGALLIAIKQDRAAADRLSRPAGQGGSLPGHIAANVRRPPLSSRTFVRATTSSSRRLFGRRMGESGPVHNGRRHRTE
jgi:hypothetical protein